MESYDVWMKRMLVICLSSLFLRIVKQHFHMFGFNLFPACHYTNKKNTMYSNKNILQVGKGKKKTRKKNNKKKQKNNVDQQECP